VLGLELLDNAALAIAIDDQGHVRARALVEATGSLATAADAALTNVTIPPDAGPLGVAAFNPDAPGLAGILAGLAGRDARSAMPAGVAAAVAEAWVGAATGVQNVAYFAVAEHTAAGIIRDGHVMLGSRGRAGSVAWLALNPVEREDYRKIGCLEAEVAAAGIVRRLVWRIKAGDHSRVAETVDNDFAKITAEHVLTAARNGDGVSISVMRDTAKYLGMAAANLVLLADPEMLVLGGVMADAADLLLEPVRAEIARRLPRPMLDALAIVPATLGADAAAIGAARHAASARR
jgi:predicted NBD/HSP70 family sugar kinase